MEKNTNIKKTSGTFNRAQTAYVINFIYLMKKSTITDSQRYMLELLEEGLEELSEEDY